MTDHLKTTASAVRNTPWLPMAGMPTNILNAAGLRIARCDFDGDFDHSDARANAAYIVAASPDEVLKLLDENAALKADVERLMKEISRLSAINFSLSTGLKDDTGEKP
jgi:hypothetical protein